LGSGRGNASVQGVPPHPRHDLRWLPQSSVRRWVVALSGFAAASLGLRVMGLAPELVEPAESDTDGQLNARCGLLPVALLVSDIALGGLWPVHQRPQASRGRSHR